MFFSKALSFPAPKSTITKPGLRFSGDWKCPKRCDRLIRRQYYFKTSFKNPLFVWVFSPMKNKCKTELFCF